MSLADRERLARQIKRTALGHIWNSNSDIQDWMTAFKDYPTVLAELELIKNEKPRDPR